MRERPYIENNYYFARLNLISGAAAIPDHQCPEEIVPHKSTSTTLRNTPLTYKHDSAGSLSITGNQ
jgi:hypothetical protein